MVCVEGHGCTQKIVGNTPETIYEKMTKECSVYGSSISRFLRKV